MDSGLMDFEDNNRNIISDDVEELINNIKKNIPFIYHKTIDKYHLEYCRKYDYQKRKVLSSISQECEIIVPDIDIDNIAENKSILPNRKANKLSHKDIVEGIFYI